MTVEEAKEMNEIVKDFKTNHPGTALNFSKLEKEIKDLKDAGYNSEEIGKKVGLSESTIKKYFL